MAIYKYLCKTFSAVTLITVLSGLLISNDSMAAVPIVQPGAPGEATRELDAETAVNIDFMHAGHDYPSSPGSGDVETCSTKYQ